MLQLSKSFTDQLLRSYLKNFLTIKSYKKCQQGLQLLDYLDREENDNLVEKVLKMVYYFYDNVSGEGKLCALQFIKEVMELGRVRIFMVLEKLMKKQLKKIVQYRYSVKSMLRGSTYLITDITKNQKQTHVANLIKISNTYYRMAHEILYVWGNEYFKESGFGQVYTKVVQYCVFPEYPGQYKFYKVGKIEENKHDEEFRCINQFIRKRKEKMRVQQVHQGNGNSRIGWEIKGGELERECRNYNESKKQCTEREERQIEVQEIEQTNTLEQPLVQKQNIYNSEVQQSRIALKPTKSKTKVPANIVYRQSSIEDPVDAQIENGGVPIPRVIELKSGNYYEGKLGIIEERYGEEETQSLSVGNLGSSMMREEMNGLESGKDRQQQQNSKVSNEQKQREVHQNGGVDEQVKDPKEAVVIPTSSQRMADGHDESLPSGNQQSNTITNLKQKSKPTPIRQQKLSLINRKDSHVISTGEQAKVVRIGCKEVPAEKEIVGERRLEEEEEEGDGRQGKLCDVLIEQVSGEESIELHQQKQKNSGNNIQKKQSKPFIIGTVPNPTINTSSKPKKHPSAKKQLYKSRMQNNFTSPINIKVEGESNNVASERILPRAKNIIKRLENIGSYNGERWDGDEHAGELSIKYIKPFKRRKSVSTKFFDSESEDTEVRKQYMERGESEERRLKMEKKVGIWSNLYSIKQLCRGDHWREESQGGWKQKITQSKLRRVREIAITLIPNPSKKMFYDQQQVKQTQKRQLATLKKQIGDELKQIQQKLEHKNQQMVDSIKDMFQQQTSKLLTPLKQLNTVSQILVKSAKGKNWEVQNWSKSKTGQIMRKSLQKVEHGRGTMLYLMARKRSGMI